ncbi:sigma-70 family RNA polymerase sigma factor [Spongiactinospora sp. TRM90649]|uniref:RNA polymerase sigma factor n=1 Tax=Spongiactinospora sp. TRM90649 TaxID=3031114 RepID=UPI0023F699D2|nr:sigma-70 family RNA polymerase sigma factor [Spongiactinospora sp. TRM90649]MDF5758337.1 sigma-70 family RNA polymerase sigma factor [Spongiactinospora sp. TRM90649]
MRDDTSVVDLVTRARDGDQEAWDQLVDRYIALVWSIARGYGLRRPDIDDVSQEVWLSLLRHLPLREPAALPGWLATTTHRECRRVVERARKREDLERSAPRQPAVDEVARLVDELLAAERRIALRAAFDRLPEPCRTLLALLVQDPPIKYAEIARLTGTAVGSIGPHRARCLERLRRLLAAGGFGMDDLTGR